jgi:hypothetical protein
MRRLGLACSLLVAVSGAVACSSGVEISVVDSATADTRESDTTVVTPDSTTTDSALPDTNAPDTRDSASPDTMDSAAPDTAVFDSGTDTIIDSGPPPIVDVLSSAASTCTTLACGRWTFGSASNATGTLVPFGSYTNRSYPSYAVDGGPLRWWSASASARIPFVMYNGTDDSTLHSARKVSFHPASSGDHAIVEWTAPLTTSYRISGSFLGKEVGSKTVRIVAAGSVVFSQSIAGATSAPFDLGAVALSAGAKVRFTVDPNGDYTSDTVSFDATLAWMDAPLCPTGSDGTACGTAMHCCGGSCVSDLAVATCGASCTPCPTRANATTTCSGTTCGFTCSSGYGNCDGNATNGCETITTGDPNNCGACANKCFTPEASLHQRPTCSSSTCGLQCEAGYSDCNANPIDGCERNTGSDNTNCGACGNLCHWTTPYCRSGVCSAT